MKKLLLLFTTLLLISCSKDDTANNDNTNADTTVLIKRITEYYDYGNTTDVFVADYLYDGNKIVSIKEYLNDNLRYTYNFTYTNNLISSYNGINERDSQYSWTSYFRYDSNNRLKEYIHKSSYDENSENFVYNGNIVTSDDCISFEFQNNQIISVTEFLDNCQTAGDITNYTYDSSPNAFSNIQGYNWYFQYDYTFQHTIEYPSGINNVTFDGYFDYAYDYNENGYPRNVTVTEDGSLVATLTIEYY